MDQATSSAIVGTARPDRYGKQLVSHLGRRVGGEWNGAEGAGWIQFTFGRAEVASHPDALHLVVHGEAGQLATLEDVVGRHLARFGAQDDLVVRWSRQDGTPGTEQRADQVTGLPNQPQD
jgi:hypothetical protein